MVARASATSAPAAGPAWAWGTNVYGALGSGSTTNSYTPVAVSMPAGVSFSAVAAGGNHSLALDGSGHAWAWGNNYYGELGNASTTNSSTPVPVSMPAGVTFSAVAAGDAHSLALDGSGHVWAWGLNDWGQLGDGSGTNSSMPVPVSMPAGVTFSAVAAGVAHSLALDSSGHAWAWGSNVYGELGYGSFAYNSSTPVAVSMPAGVSFSAVSAGLYHSLAIDGSGHAWAWGTNTWGELGNGTAGYSTARTPVAVSMPAGVTFSAVAAGGFYSLALDGSGHAWAWGSNGSGELGDGSTTNRSTPVAVSMPAGVAFSAVAAAKIGGDGGHNVALDGSGHAWAWGAGNGGDLGDGSTAYVTAPVAVSMPPGVTFSAVSAGASYSLALQVAADGAISANGVTFNATEGTAFTGTVASFSDPDSSASASEYQATIDWGDGTPGASGTVSGGGGSFAVTGGPHTYAEEGTYKATVTVTDTDNTTNSATANTTATVADAALTSTCAAPTTSPLSFTNPTASFHDANPGGTVSDYRATIDWGDSSSSPGTISTATGPANYTVGGTHTYPSTGPYTIQTTIRDQGGANTVASCSTVVFAFPSGGGSFVIGDQVPGTSIGAPVTFWGSQWAKNNTLTGGSPSSFKGFEDAATVPACGTTWVTDPGDSPPPSVPAYIGVIVSSHVEADPDNHSLTGDTVHIVVVKTNPGYGPRPGTPGAGTIVDVVC